MELRFREQLIEKEKEDRKQVLVARYRMIKSASQGSVRTRAQARTIQTSQSSKRVGKGDFLQY